MARYEKFFTLRWSKAARQMMFWVERANMPDEYLADIIARAEAKTRARGGTIVTREEYAVARNEWASEPL